MNKQYKIGVALRFTRPMDMRRYENFFFGLMREHTRKWRHMAGLVAGGEESGPKSLRRSLRIQPEPKSAPVVQIRRQRPGAVSTLESAEFIEEQALTADEPNEFIVMKVFDLSNEGVALTGPLPAGVNVGCRLEVTIKGAEVDLHVEGTVVYMKEM